MKVAIVGAGALGCTYAAHLAEVAEVVLVVRASERAPRRVVLERVGSAGPPRVLEAPAIETSVPADADVVLLAVRVDQVDPAQLRAIAASGPPDRVIVALTPMLPELRARVVEALGPLLVDAMPGVAAYAPKPPSGGELCVRYWTPKSAPTILEEHPDDPARGAKVRRLADALARSGMPVRVSRKVHEENQATTIAMFPLLLAIAAAGSVERLLADRALLKLALAATKETRAIAKTVGELAAFASILLSFAGPLTLRAGMKIVHARAPEAVTFLEQHFGRKLREQNRVMFEAIAHLGEARRLEVSSLRALAAQAGIS